MDVLVNVDFGDEQRGAATSSRTGSIVGEGWIL